MRIRSPFPAVPHNFGRLWCDRCSGEHFFVSYEEAHREIKWARCSNCGWWPGEVIETVADTSGRISKIHRPVIPEAVVKRALEKLRVEMKDYFVRLGFPEDEASRYARTSPATDL